MTAQGHPRTVFRRAIERGNLVAAELNAGMMGNVTLGEALELTALVSLHSQARGSRFATRWLQGWLAERGEVSSGETALVAAALVALGGPKHHAALGLLRQLLEP